MARSGRLIVVTTRDTLRQQTRALIDGAASARETARQQSAPYVAWFTRVQLLVDQLGPVAATFKRELETVRDVRTYQLRIQAEEDRASQLGRSRFNPAEVHQWMVDSAAGLVQGLDEALAGDLLRRVEDRVASEIYDDVLAEAEGLLRGNHVPCAAILVRVGLENGLRRLGAREGMPAVDTAKASAINDWLWKDRQLYAQATNRQVQSWLDPGNAFAHDKPEKSQYDAAHIAKTLEDVRSFLGLHSL